MLRVYGWLLRLLPRSLRERSGPEMERLVRAMRAEGRAGPGFWLRLTWDLVSQAVAARGARLREGMTMTRRVEEPMTTFVSDLRYAFRRILRQPLFSATVVLLVAVGIAGNAAVFRIVNGLFLRPLPFPGGERLVDLDETAPDWNLEYVGIAIPDFRAWQEHNETFESMVALSQSGANLEVDGGSIRVSYLATTHDVDEVLRLEPLLGRFYTPDEDLPDAPPVIMLSRGFWEAQFGADHGVLGRTVRLDGRTAEIVGVLPGEAGFVADADLWMPLRENEESSFYLDGIGRLREGATLERAREDLLAAHRTLLPDRTANEVTSPTVTTLRDRYLGEYRLGSGVLVAAVGLVLLIACANIAGLMVARSVGRRPEIAVRRALGARRGRLIGQLLTESVVLAGIGAVAGTVLGVWGSGRLLAMATDSFPAWVSFELDARFVAFSVLATMGAVVLFGLTPAVRGSAAGRATGAGSGRATASRGTRRTLSWLVAGEVAAAAAILVVAGLTIQDVREVGRVDPGFRPEGLVTWRVQLGDVRYPEREDRLAFAERYRERLGVLPGVVSASLASALPLMGHSGWFFEVQGHERAEGESGPVVLRRWVSPGYLDEMGLTLLRGRALAPSDGRSEGELVVVVNETFVETHVPEGMDPLGLRIHTGGESPYLYMIVGVVRDVKHYGLDKEMRPGTFEPLAQNPVASMQVALRTTGDPLSLVPSARAATAELDPGLPLFDVRTMAERFDEALLGRRATAWLIGSFSGVALLLAVAGLYGVISYTVSQRAGEISVRMAMGAAGGAVSRQVVRQGMLLVAWGLVMGLGAAFLVSGPVSGLLVEGRVTDPWVYGGVALLLLGVAAVANWIPARRAAAMDPMAALRGE